MQIESFFYNCSKEYIQAIEPSLFDKVIQIVNELPKRGTQSEINQDLVWLLTQSGWSFDVTPNGMPETPTIDINLTNLDKSTIKFKNNRNLCKTSTTLDADWHADFAMVFNGKLVQIEAQFGKVESMFKDFCGFRIARYERRLALGVEIVISEPNTYFSHRKGSVSGMAYYDIARKTLPAIGLDCPIWLIGLKG